MGVLQILHFTNTLGVRTWDGNGSSKIAYHQILCELESRGWCTEANCILTGSEELSNNTEILELYPNPTNGKIRLHAPESSSSAINIKVMDISGNVLIDKQFLLNSDNELDIDLSGYADGMYIISTTINSKPFYQKVMKN